MGSSGRGRRAIRIAGRVTVAVVALLVIAVVVAAWFEAKASPGRTVALPTATPVPTAMASAAAFFAPRPSPTSPVDTSIACAAAFGANQPAALYPVCMLNVGQSASVTLKSGVTRTVTLRGVRPAVTANNGACDFVYRAMATVDVEGDAYSLGVGMTQPYTVAKGVRMYAADSSIFGKDGCANDGVPGDDIALVLTDASAPLFDTSLYRYPWKDYLWGLNPHIGREDDAGGRHHGGWDFGMPVGSKVYAPADGRIDSFAPTYASAHPFNNTIYEFQPTDRGVPAMVLFHLKELAPGVSKGSLVKKGQWLATSFSDKEYGFAHSMLAYSSFGNEFPFIRETYYADMLTQPRYQGYIKDWLMIGPFSDPSPGRLSNDHLNGREGSLRPSDGLATGGQSWRTYDNLIPGVVDVASALSPAPYSGYAGVIEKDNPNSVAYASVYIRSPVSQAVRLWLGYNDGVKVWLNGNLVHTDDANYLYDQGSQNDMAPDQVKLPVRLNAGWNHLMLKISQDSSDTAMGAMWATANSWKFSARLVDAGGKPVSGLALQTSDPCAAKAASC